MSILEFNRIKRNFRKKYSKWKKTINYFDLSYFIFIIILLFLPFEILKVVLYWVLSILFFIGHLIIFKKFEKKVLKEEDEDFIEKNYNMLLGFLSFGRIILFFVIFFFGGAILYEHYYIIILSLLLLILSLLNYLGVKPVYIKLYLIRYFRVIVFLVFITFMISGLILTFSLPEDLNLIYSQSLIPFFTLFISILIAIFGFSLTIYALILKLTLNSTISYYMQDKLKIKNFCILYIIMLILLIINYLFFYIFNIYMNILSVVLLLLFPTILIIYFALVDLIIKILSATTVEGSLKFFTDNPEREKEKCYKLYDFWVKSSKSKKIPMRSAVKKFEDKFYDFHKDALIIIIEIQEKSKSINPRLFYKIGKAIVPPYTTLDFINNRFRVLIRNYYEEYPQYGIRFIYLLEGYIDEMLDSDFFDNVMLREIQYLIGELQTIGSIKEKSFRSTILIDEKNQILDRITKKIMGLDIKDNELALKSTREDIMRKVSDIIALEDYDSCKIGALPDVYERKLFRLKKYLETEKSLPIKKIIFDKTIHVLEKILYDTNEYFHPPIFSYDFYYVWKNYLTEKFFLNPYIINKSLNDYASEISKKILEALKASISRFLEKNRIIDITYSYINQISRIYVDLAFHLSSLCNENEEPLFHEKIKKFSQSIYENYLGFVGELNNSKFDIDLRYLIGGPIIMGAHFVNSIKEFDIFILNNARDKKIGVLSAFGIKILMKEVFQKELDSSELKEVLFKNIEDIENLFLIKPISDDTTQMEFLGEPEDIRRHHDIIIESVYYFGGFEDILGNFILDILEVIANQDIIQKYLGELNK